MAFGRLFRRLAKFRRRTAVSGVRAYLGRGETPASVSLYSNKIGSWIICPARAQPQARALTSRCHKGTLLLPSGVAKSLRPERELSLVGYGAERDRLKATIAELESKNALLQADLQLARDIGVLTASGPEATLTIVGDRATSRDRQESNTRARLGAVKACPRGWVGYEELLVRTGRASSNALVFAVSQRESLEQGFGGEGLRRSPSAIGSVTRRRR